MDMSKTLSDLPTDLHQLILSHDEEKIELKKENEKLKTRVKMLQCLLDEARQDSDSDEEALENLGCGELKARLRDLGEPVGGTKPQLIRRIRNSEAIIRNFFLTMHRSENLEAD